MPRSDGDRDSARGLVARYHREQLGKLLEHVRGGFEQMDAGEIDEFELDALIHRYKLAESELWKFCNADRQQFRLAAEAAVQDGAGPDWWTRAEPRRRR